MRRTREVAAITAVEVLDGFRLRLTFRDGFRKDVDLEPMLRGGVFGALRSDRHLFEAVRVDHESETIVWPNGADICPDLLRYDLRPAGPPRRRPRPRSTPRRT